MNNSNSTIRDKAIEWWDDLSEVAMIFAVAQYHGITFEDAEKGYHEAQGQYSDAFIETIYLSEHPEQAMDFKKIKEDSEDLQALISAEMQEQQMENEDAEIDKLERELWNEPTGAPTTKKEVAVDNSKEGFTEGEWKQEGTTRGLNGLYIKANNQAIAQVYSSINECAANARLIAQAPDMYTALKSLMDDEDVCSVIGRNNTNEFKAILNKIDNK